MSISNSLFTDSTRCDQQDLLTQRYNRILNGINSIISIDLKGNTEEEMRNACLSVVLEITGSQLGFIGEVDKNGLLNNITVSDLGWVQRNKYDKSGHKRLHRDFILNSLYGGVINSKKGFFTNDPLSLSNRDGVLPDNSPLTSFLGVPLIEKEKAVGMLGVANRERGYSCEQLEDLEAIVPAVVQTLRRIKEERERRQIENALHDSYEQMQTQAEELLIQSDELLMQNDVLKANFNKLQVKNIELQVQSKKLQKEFEALGADEERFLLAKEETDLGIHDYDVVSGTIQWDSRVRELWGVGQEVVISYDTFMAGLHPEDRAATQEKVDKALDPAGNGKYYTEYRVINKIDGMERWVTATGHVIFKHGQAVRLISFVQDITERKRIEAALQESEERLLLAQQVAKIGTFEWNIQTGVNIWSPELEAMYGLQPGEFSKTQQAWEQLVYPDDRQKAISIVDQAFQTGEPVEGEWRVIWPDGSIHRITGCFQAFNDKSGQPLRLTGVNIDITERKRSEVAMLEKEAELQLIADATPVILNRLSRDLKYVFANRACAQMLGRTQEEIIGKSIVEILGEDAFETIRPHVEKVLQGQRVEYETEIPYKGVSPRFMQVVYIPERNMQGEVVGWLASISDITERKRAEEALRKSQIKLENELVDTKLLQSISAELLPENNAQELYEKIIDAAMQIMHSDYASMQMLYPEHGNGGELKLLAFRGFNPEAAKFWEWVRADSESSCGIALRTGKRIISPDVENCDFMDGSEDQATYIQTGIRAVQTTPLVSRTGKLVGMISTHWRNPHEPSDRNLRLLDILVRQAADIIERKKAEQDLKNMNETLEVKVQERTSELEKTYNYLKEIEIVRKQEIHHRIKNNLQVISSLLDLQAEKFTGKKNIEDSQVLEAFKESQNRVISMALIHEELHKGGGIDTLNFSQYIEELADNLLLTYRLGNDGISMDMDIEEQIFFGMDTAVPLGIIINEIISNSFKYAFIGRDEGKIRIKLHREETVECKSTKYVLSVSDNGIGIPEDLDIEDLDSLGLQLVTTLVDQLDGELELERHSGTKFTIRFMVTENNNSVSVPATQQSV